MSSDVHDTSPESLASKGFRSSSMNGEHPQPSPPGRRAQTLSVTPSAVHGPEFAITASVRAFLVSFREFVP